jgi:hypothetical protein
MALELEVLDAKTEEEEEDLGLHIFRLADIYLQAFENSFPWNLILPASHSNRTKFIGNEIRSHLADDKTSVVVIRTAEEPSSSLTVKPGADHRIRSICPYSRLGSKLLDWGTERSRKDGIPIYLQCPLAAAPFFEDFGEDAFEYRIGLTFTVIDKDGTSLLRTASEVVFTYPAQDHHRANTLFR